MGFLTRATAFALFFTLTGCGPAESFSRPEIHSLYLFLSPELSQSIGFYSDGRLTNASELPLEGVGFIKVMRDRKRHFGSSELVITLMWATSEVSRYFPQSERLGVGDMSSQFGGPQSGHASHQNGLDADLSFYKTNRRELDPDASEFGEHFTRGNKVSSNFDVVRNWFFVSRLVSTGIISRIFLDQRLKLKFCALAAKDGLSAEETEALRRVNHWPGHDDHFHVRLTCPRNSPECINQVDPPLGPGCESYSKAEESARGVFLLP
ncbi:MAG: penicillin-insensitive murein endopeptidase [Oligoflexia bacterium]|nr:penicillin-insensitive murein endopeptidase [Oligoflexia bacterium]